MLEVGTCYFSKANMKRRWLNAADVHSADPEHEPGSKPN